MDLPAGKGADTMKTKIDRSKITQEKPSSRSHAPTWEWLWSRQDLRIKLQAVCALLLLTFAAVWHRQGSLYLSHRDEAYHRLLSASARSDQLSIMEAAADFLKWPNRGNRDGRDSQVWKLYSKTLTRWTIGRMGHLDDRDLRLAADYKRLSQASN
jgi:hypothetical protein